MPARILLTSLLFGLLTGCLGTASTPPDYYLLTAGQSTADAAPATARLDTSIGVGPVRVAPFLDRPQIVTHGGSGALVLPDDQRWSEPLDQGIQRVLEQNLATLTGADIRDFPWTQSTIPTFAVRLDVIDLDRDGDQAVLEANWILQDLQRHRLLASRRERITTAVAGGANDYRALTRAYSDLLAQLARHIAAALGSAPPTPADPPSRPSPAARQSPPPAASGQ